MSLLPDYFLRTTKRCNEGRKRGPVLDQGMVHKGCVNGRTLASGLVTTEKFDVQSRAQFNYP